MLLASSSTTSRDASLRVIPWAACAISLRAETDADPVAVSGSVLGRDHERVTQVNGFEIEVTPAGHMVFFTYVDRPGIIGRVGTLLGDAGINIATMDVGRKAEGGDALMCLTVDTEVSPEVLEGVADQMEAHQLRTVTLPN